MNFSPEPSIQSIEFKYPITDQLISIIVPIYNAEDSIEISLKSILNQTYHFFEVIIIDDGSNDNSHKIIKKYTQLDQRFKYFKKKNEGVSTARNLGLTLAHGEYIQFIDADDAIEPNYLDTMHALITQHKADVAICQFYHPIFQSNLKNKRFNLNQIEHFTELYSDTLAMIVPWNKLWKRECLKLGFDHTVHFAEDELFNLANIFNAKTVITTDLKLYHYTVHDHSCVNTAIKNDVLYPTITKENLLFSRIVSLQPKREAIIQNAIQEGLVSSNIQNNILYSRVLDFFFWHLVIYLHSGATIERLIIDYKYIVQHPIFIKSLEAKENWTVKIEDLKKEKLINNYINTCAHIFYENEHTSPLQFTYMFRAVFFHNFLQLNTSRSNNSYDVDISLALTFTDDKLLKLLAMSS